MSPEEVIQTIDQIGLSLGSPGNFKMLEKDLLIARADGNAKALDYFMKHYNPTIISIKRPKLSTIRSYPAFEQGHSFMDMNNDTSKRSFRRFNFLKVGEKNRQN